ncbi:hypothetical protein EDD15DRAFT_2216252 [Pisolithus albus]|nr:hypothetical protein EDD15DRAFT_2216252 [Pisolithus albus]
MQPCFSVLFESTIPSILTLVFLTCTAATTTTIIIRTEPRDARISHDSTCPCIGAERERYRFGRLLPPSSRRPKVSFRVPLPAEKKIRSSMVLSLSPRPAVSASDEANQIQISMMGAPQLFVQKY